MAVTSETDRLIVERIRNQDDDAWAELISRYEGRLLAFVESRIGRRAASTGTWFSRRHHKNAR